MLSFKSLIEELPASILTISKCTPEYHRVHTIF